jgi:rubrerythrin
MAIEVEQRAVATYNFIANKSDDPDVRAWAQQKAFDEGNDLNEATEKLRQVTGK